MQFVLRLSPEDHRRISELTPGIVTGPISPEGLQAFSTYLHETIHWWQHIGSTVGFLLSLSFPAQAHANYTHLKNLLQAIGAKKSLLRFIETSGNPGGPGTSIGLANTVVNNHFDIEFFRILITNPSLVQEVVNHRLFESVGHSYQVTYANALLILAASLNTNFDTIPDPRPWESAFAALRAQKKKGYHFGSDVTIAPIGANGIFEGQARFSQLQYLYFASGRTVTWDDVHRRRMLEGIYGQAFQTFLDLARLDWPSSIDHPVVALFLLLCDVAINPGAGFPLPLHSFQTFIEDVDPGIRFLFLCRTIATKRTDLARAITKYSKDEYLHVSDALAKLLWLDAPRYIGQTLTNWVGTSEDLRSLMNEYRTFEYSAENLPVRVLFSHFLAFNEDKFQRPEFFCWPGAWMTGARVSTDVATLFERHSALFVDKADDDGIFPRILVGKDDKTVHRTFESFYGFNVTYDMTRQWIAQPGPFKYDYRWLSSGTPADAKGFADRHFEMTYSVSPDRFNLI